jgi:hypothetical protein
MPGKTLSDNQWLIMGMILLVEFVDVDNDLILLFEARIGRSQISERRSHPRGWLFCWRWLLRCFGQSAVVLFGRRPLWSDS